MTTTAERFEFQTEARQLLDLMIHSVYSHPEIFLRELISNASDALDKLRFEALTDNELTRFTSNPQIRIIPDKEARTLTVEDNGIGMSREEVIRFIGTIAKSGTGEYMKALKEAKGSELPPELIGQFGVGFYSSFMVADKVTLITRRAGEDIGVKWESTGDGTYTLEEAHRFEPGTTIILHLKPHDKSDDEHDEVQDFTDEWTIRSTVKKYSDFVSYPIKMPVTRTERERDETGKVIEGSPEKAVTTEETLNSMKAIWTRPEKEVTEEEYNEFYKHISHDWSDPMKRIIMRAEGTTEFRALLFIPGKAPHDLFMRDSDRGIQLYIKRVFIMSDCKELIPEYLRFMRGVVDSEDLSLNISREILQQNRQIQVIRKGIVRKILDTLRTMRKDENEKYLKFWSEFGRVMKEGIFHDSANRDALLELSLFPSTNSQSELTSLVDYVSRMKPEQKTIYYMTGASRAAVENSPHLEAFKDKEYEVLFLTDPVDEVWVQTTFEYKEKQFKSVGKGEHELGSDEEKKKAQEERKDKEGEFRPVLDALKSKLEENVKEVRLSNRLTSSPACLVGEQHDLTPQLEALLRANGQDVPKVKRILELNPSHSILQKLKGMVEANKDDERLGDYAELLYGQALLAEGGTLPDPGSFSRKLASLMERAM